MKTTLQELWVYIKTPVLQKDQHTAAAYRYTKFFHLLLLCLITGFAFMPVFGLLESLELINMDDHAMTEVLENFSKPTIFFLVVVVAPLLEELIFRAPITLFDHPKTFKIAFYVFAIIFGLVHLSNFTNITNTVLILTPILVAPQILLGFYLGYIRVRFGLIWSIGLHACYNGTLMLLSFFVEF